MWWVDLLGVGAALAAWVFIPRWTELTRSFYRSRGWGFLAIGGGLFIVVFRTACALIILFGIVNLVGELTHSF